MHPRIEAWKTDFVEGIMEDHGLWPAWTACWIKAYNEIQAKRGQDSLVHFHERAFGHCWEFYAYEDGRGSKRRYFWEFKPGWRVNVCNAGDVEVEVPEGASLKAAWAAWKDYLKRLGIEAGPCPEKTPLVAFYTGGKHPDGLSFEEALAQPNEMWERCHNYVQWFFPLPEASRMQPGSPVAVEADFKGIGISSKLRDKLFAAVERYERFLLEYDGWRRAHDHNHLRITRVIRCLVLMGYPERARQFYAKALTLGNATVNRESLGFWREAMLSKAPWDKEG